MNIAETNRTWPESGSTTRIPFWVYTDPKIFDLEMERLFHGATWNYVGLEAEIPEKGDHKNSWIGNKPVIVTRDGQGEIHVLENRCTHKGMKLCWTLRGNSKVFTCPYHQWCFGLDGRLRGLPFLAGHNGAGGMPEDFDKQKHSLRSLRVHRQNGLIFASFCDETEDFEQYCGEDVLYYVNRQFPGREIKLLGYNRQIITSNWKLYFENLKDPYHATLLHSFFVTFGLWRADSNSQMTPSEDGKHGVMISQNIGKGGTDQTKKLSTYREQFELEDLETVTGIPEFEDRKVVGTTLFPSVVFQQQANTMATRHIIPKSHDSMELVWTYFGYADDSEEMTKRRLRHANLVGPAGYVSMDDSEVLNQTQLVAEPYQDRLAVVEMGGKDTQAADYMVTEVLIRAFYNYYREAMGL